VATAFSLYVMRGTRTLAIASDAMVANYVAESGVEEGLYMLRHESENVPASATPVLVSNLESPYVITNGLALARIVSSTRPATDANDVPFANADAYAELWVSSMANEILMDVPKDQVQYADVYDASQPTDLIGSSIQSVSLQWDAGDGLGWLESSLVELSTTGDINNRSGTLLTPRTTLIGPSFNTGYCFSNLPLNSGANIHRFRFRALYGDIRNLRVIGYGGTDCQGDTLPLPGRTTVSATGKYRQATQSVQISMPQHNLPSGLFGFVMFSDQSLVKLNAGVGNLQFWPQITSAYQWPDDTQATPNTFRFLYPNGADFIYPGEGDLGASSTVSLPTNYLGTDPVYYPNGAPILTLVNTDQSGTSYNSGNIILAISDNYVDKLSLDYSFSNANLPEYPVANPAIKKCNDQLLQVNSQLQLREYGSTHTEMNTEDLPAPIDIYYTDRCAVGVRLDPSGVTAETPLTGSLVAYADPGGSARMNFELASRPIPTEPNIVVIPSLLWFGNVGIGQQFTRAVTISNNGNDSLIISSMDLSGSGAARYSFTPSAPITIPAGGSSITLNVTYTPFNPITDSANLAIASNDPDTPLFHLEISGYGVMNRPVMNECWGLGTSIRCEWSFTPPATWSGTRYRLTRSNTYYGVYDDVASNIINTYYEDSTSNANTMYYYKVHAGDQLGHFSGASNWQASTREVASASTRIFFVSTAPHNADFTTGFSSWQVGANTWCRDHAPASAPVGRDYRAWMQGTSLDDDTQLLMPNATYVWMNQSFSGSGASFRTDSSRTPWPQSWNSPRTGLGAYNINSVKTNIASVADQPRSTNEGWSCQNWSRGDNNAQFGAYGGQPFYPDCLNNDCRWTHYWTYCNESSPIYCFEAPTALMTGQPSGLAVTWAEPFTYNGTWLDGVTGETGYRLGSTVPSTSLGTLNHPLLSAGSTSGSYVMQAANVNACIAATTMGTWSFYADATNGIAWTPRALSTADRPGLETPTNLSVEWINSTSINLHWADTAANEDGYVVYQNNVPIATTTANVTFRAVSGLSQGTTYTYKVRAYFSSNQGGMTRCSPAVYVYGAYSNSFTYTAVANVKRIAVSTTLHDGNLMSLSGGATLQQKVDTLCSNDFGGNWKGLLWRVDPPNPDLEAYLPPASFVILPGVIHGGQSYANNWNYLLFPASANDVTPDTLSASIGNSNAPYTWTGRRVTVVANQRLATCGAAWSGGGLGGIVGDPRSTLPTLWGEAGWNYCIEQHPIYCVEQ
jgi:hypothetical protein